MNHWHYRITMYTAADVLDKLPEAMGQAPPVMFCNDEGACYFDAGPNPYTKAIEQLLDQTGQEGWELVQVTFRANQMICFWKQPR